MRSERIRKVLIIVLILLNVACDQWSKTYVENQVPENSYSELAGPLLILTYVKNNGAFLGMGQDWSPWVKRIFLHGLPLALLLYLVYRLLFNEEANTWLTVGFSFILGGGLGNIVDRFRFGEVTDFFQMQIGPVHTGIFNMADVSVTTGIILVFIGYRLNRKDLAV